MRFLFGPNPKKSKSKADPDTTSAYDFEFFFFFNKIIETTRKKRELTEKRRKPRLNNERQC